MCLLLVPVGRDRRFAGRIMPGEAARFPGDEAEAKNQQGRAERDGSPEHHDRSLNARTAMRKQFVAVAAILTFQVR